MIWFLVLGGILLILLGVWGGPKRRKRPDKAGRIQKNATVQEAWDILTSPVQYEEELIKIPEHKPWYVPGSDRRFHQGLLVGLGCGLMVAAVLMLFIPRKEALPQQQAAANPPAGQVEQQPAAQTPPPQTPPAQGQAPAPARAANVSFTVEPGSSTQEIAANLKAAGLIADEQKFLELVVGSGMETRLQAGTFVIPTGATQEKVLEKLTQ